MAECFLIGAHILYICALHPVNYFIYCFFIYKRKTEQICNHNNTEYVQLFLLLSEHNIYPLLLSGMQLFCPSNSTRSVGHTQPSY